MLYLERGFHNYIPAIGNIDNIYLFWYFVRRAEIRLKQILLVIIVYIINTRVLLSDKNDD